MSPDSNNTDMKNKFLADFLFKLLTSSSKNIELFYTSFLPDKVCGTFNFYEAIPFGSRLLSILFEEDNSPNKQLLIKHLKALYKNYDSLYLQSVKTIENGELDNNPPLFDKAFDNGDLNCHEFNNIIKVLIENYRQNSFYYELGIDKIKISSPRKILSQRDKEREILLIEKNEKVYLTFFKIKERIPKVKSIKELLKAKGSVKAIRISNAIKNIIKKMQTNEPCCWCNPSKNTKAKCFFCNELGEKYNLLLSQHKNLAKDLNQIIKRVQKKHEYSNIEDLRKEIKDKIKSYVKDKCKNNHSEAYYNFSNALTKWYRNI